MAKELDYREGGESGSTNIVAPTGLSSVFKSWAHNSDFSIFLFKINRCQAHGARRKPINRMILISSPTEPRNNWIRYSLVVCKSLIHAQPQGTMKQNCVVEINPASTILTCAMSRSRYPRVRALCSSRSRFPIDGRPNSNFAPQLPRYTTLNQQHLSTFTRLSLHFPHFLIKDTEYWIFCQICNLLTWQSPTNAHVGVKLPEEIERWPSTELRELFRPTPDIWATRCPPPSKTTTDW